MYIIVSEIDSFFYDTKFLEHYLNFSSASASTAFFQYASRDVTFDVSEYIDNLPCKLFFRDFFCLAGLEMGFGCVKFSKSL